MILYAMSNRKKCIIKLCQLRGPKITSTHKKIVQHRHSSCRPPLSVRNRPWFIKFQTWDLESLRGQNNLFRNTRKSKWLLLEAINQMNGKRRCFVGKWNPWRKYYKFHHYLYIFKICFSKGFSLMALVELVIHAPMDMIDRWVTKEHYLVNFSQLVHVPMAANVVSVTESLQQAPHH